MSLEELRKKIDELDEELLQVLSKRFAVISEIAELKKRDGIPLRQPKREKELIERGKALAKKYCLDESFVEKIYLMIIKESLKAEKKH